MSFELLGASLFVAILAVSMCGVIAALSLALFREAPIAKEIWSR
jgi:hypothetical protein